jgi:hypothetical protein
VLDHRSGVPSAVSQAADPGDVEAVPGGPSARGEPFPHQCGGVRKAEARTADGADRDLSGGSWWLVAGG